MPIKPMCCKTGESDKWLMERLIHLRGTAIIIQLRLKGIATENGKYCLRVVPDLNILKNVFTIIYSMKGSGVQKNIGCSYCVEKKKKN